MTAVGLGAQRSIGSLTAAFDDLLGRPVSIRALELLRVLVGPVVLLHLEPFLADSLDGRVYSDAFHEPYASWYPEAPDAVYTGLLWLAAGAAVLMSLGLLTRAATATTFAIVTYNLFLSTTHFHNNRAYLVIVLGLLTVAPCGRELSVDAWLRRRRGQPLPDLRTPAWPVWLLRLECAAIYGASGLSKLVDPDWFGGTVTWQRVVRARDDLEAWPLPDWTISLLTNRDFHTGAAKVVVLTELFIAVGLWLRRTRYAAVWVAVVFHVMIEASASVQVATSAGHRRLRAIIRALDWLARFRVEPAAPRSALEVVDRDGTRLRGASATAMVFSRLPLTAWFALPTLLLPGVRHARAR